MQFIISGLLFSLLSVVNSQYNMMVNTNPGFDYENVAIVNIEGSDGDQRAQCLSEIKRMPGVVQTASTYSVPLENSPHNGNNLSLPGDDRTAMVIYDTWGIDDNYFKMMDIPIVEGSFFTERTDSSRQVIIDETLAKKLSKLGHWKDGAVGKRVFISSHCKTTDETMTICGVVKDVRYGTMQVEQRDIKDCPFCYFYSEKPGYYMLIKYDNLTADVLAALQHKVQQMYPNSNVAVASYEAEFAAQYDSQLNFRNGILVAGIVTLVIALFGLVGYTSDEVNRRRKEIAVRKVNGAKVKDILELFMRSVVDIALPCIIVGDVAAWIIARQWLMSFSEKVSLSPLIFFNETVLLLAIICLSVAANCYRVANSNPVKYLKDE
jgi:putative ABC transport system permease protein